MTRTSRHMPEPPIIDPLAATALAARDADARAAALQDAGDAMRARVPRDRAGALVGLAAMIASASIVIAGAVALGKIVAGSASASSSSTARPESSSAAAGSAAPGAPDIACRAPAPAGEQLAIFFRHDAGRIVWRCISSRDWDVMPKSAPPSTQSWSPM